MTTYSVFGAGNLGASLIYSLNSNGYTLNHIYSRSKFKIFSPYIENNLGKIINRSGIFFISVSESQLKDIVKKIAAQKDLSGKTFFQTSNSLTSGELDPLREKGAHAASFSPLQTFPDFNRDENIFKGVYFLSEGDPEAIIISEKISENLNAFNLKIDRDSKIFFHIGAVISSNFLNSLLRFADSQVKKGGNYDFRILLPLIRETLNNIEEKGLKGSLSGPVKRKEFGIVSEHLNALHGRKKEIYKLLSDLISEDI